MLADIMTKPIPATQLCALRDKLGIQGPKSSRVGVLARRRLDQPQPTGRYWNLQVWILVLCMLQFVKVSQTTIRSKLCSMMGLEIAKGFAN